MRILYLCADRGISLEKHNGATAHFRSLVRAFQGIGADVLVVTPSSADPSILGADVGRIPTPFVLRELLEDIDQPVPRSERDAQRARKRVVHALGHVWNNVATEIALQHNITRFHPDFVFELHSPYGAAGALTCNRLGVRHVLNVHAPLAWEGATFRSQALQEAAELLEDTALRAARRIIANSSQMRDQLVDAGVDRDRIDVVVNGVDLELFSPDGPVNRPVEDGIVIGFSGSLKGWHGIEVLCDAFREVATDPRLHLLVIGDGPLRGDVARLADELPGRVTMTGALPLEDVPAWLRAVDIAVAPYPPLERFYFSPLKILDAMACGVANIASDIGQIPELLRDGETGLLVQPGSTSALVAALRRLVDEDALRRRIGAAGLEEARARHAWTTRAGDIAAIAMEQPMLVSA